MKADPTGAKPSSVLADTLLGLGALVVSGILWWGSAGLPPPRFEPMGSAALPQILAALITLFALIILLRAVLSQRQLSVREENLEASPSVQRDPSEASASPTRAVIVLILLLIYVAALDMGRLPFLPCTVVLVTVLGVLLSKPSLRNLAGFALFGFLLAFAIDTVFTQFLYVDLG